MGANRALLANYLQGRATPEGRNYSKNDSCFLNTRYFTAVNTATVTKNTTAPLTQISDCQIFTTAVSDAVTVTLDAFDNGLKNQNGELRFTYKLNLGADATVVAQVIQNSVVIADLELEDTATLPRVASLNFPIGDLSNATTIRFIQTVGVDDSTLNVADLYVGRATNLKDVSQSELFGSVRYSAVNCLWSASPAGSVIDFTADADCTPAAEIVGNVAESSNDLPEIEIASMPPGRYEITVSGSIASSGAIGRTAIVLTDETNTIFGSSAGTALDNSANIDENTLHVAGTYVVNTALSNKRFKIRAKDVAGTPTVSITADPTSASRSLQITVKRFPLESQLALTPETVAWRVDANIGGANPVLGTSAITSYTEITNAGLTLTQNAGSIATEIACSGTNPSTGTTCAVGNESLGIAFNLPRAGAVLACASFSHSFASDATGTVSTTFQIVETPNNAQTILQEGNTRVNSAGGNNSANQTPHRLCGVFNFSSAGQKTLRLMYEQSVSATVAENLIRIDQDANNGQRDMHWEVYPIDQQVPAPLLVNSVVTPYEGVVKMVSAFITNAGTPTVSREIGSWISSITDDNIGEFTINHSGVFSSKPVCTATRADGTAGYVIIQDSGSSASATKVFTYTSVPASGDFDINITCMGPA